LTATDIKTAKAELDKEYGEREAAMQHEVQRVRLRDQTRFAQHTADLQVGPGGICRHYFRQSLGK
jgi:hypothetical protein